MRTKTFLLGLSLLLTVFAVAVAGQVVGEPYRISDRDVTRLLDRIKNKTDGFRQNLKDALKKNRLDRGRRDDIDSYVKAVEEDTKRLDDHFDHHKSTAADVDSVLQRASRIDTFMTLNPLDARSQNAWASLRSDLDQLADAYNIRWQWSRDWRTPDFNPPVSAIPYRVSDKEVEQIIHRVESQSDTFRKSLDRALDKSRFNDTRREDDINAFVKEFYKETKTLHGHFDSHKSTSVDVQTVLDRAAQIDQFMRRNRLQKNAQRDWSILRASLDELAQVYNVSWRWQ
jgi:hypothetical protein